MTTTQNLIVELLPLKYSFFSLLFFRPEARTEMGENARFKNGHARFETRGLKTLACRKKCRRLLEVL